jgi:hypothetical protein
MGFTVYQSTDASAPVLTGQVNSLVALLDACLVNGYGSMAAAGWTKPYTGTNKAAFQQGAGSGFFLRVQDDGPGTGAAREARMTGYETMSDVDTGTGPFPTAAQGVGGVAMLVCRKSDTADATARAWVVIADARTVYVLISFINTAYVSFTFGDFYSFTPSDAYNCIIVGKLTENAAGAAITTERLDAFSGITTAVTGHFCARTYNGTGTSITIGKHGDSANSASNNVGIQQYPNGPDGGLYLARVLVCENTFTAVRGWMRGYWHYCHAQANIQTFDTFSGTGDFAGRTFLAFRSGNSGVHVFETSNTVETN